MGRWSSVLRADLRFRTRRPCHAHGPLTKTKQKILRPGPFFSGKSYPTLAADGLAASDPTPDPEQETRD